ncbi:MAG: hypothetical protein Sapg2KO_08160 [Saprospiraceae bacterium]
MYRLIVFLVIFLSKSIVNGQSIRQLDSNRYWVGVPQMELYLTQARSVNSGKQLQSRWCWAACIQMILNYHGLAVHQEDLVRQLYGTRWINKGADEDQMLMALNNWNGEQLGKPVNILAKGGLRSPEVLIKALAYKWPLIVGLSKAEEHHAVVLTSIEYLVDQGRFIPLKVSLFDPWPDAPSNRDLTWPEFKQQCSAAIEIKLVR